MARGRRAKPTKQKELAGNPGHRKLNAAEPEFPPGIPAPPESVSSDPVALAEWRRVVPLLLESKVLSHGDYAVLVQYCTQFSLYESAVILVRTGVLLKTKYGPKKNPAITVMQDAAKQVRSSAVELGMTPAARSKVSKIDAPEGEEAKKKDKFFGEKAPKLSSSRPN